MASAQQAPPETTAALAACMRPPTPRPPQLTAGALPPRVQKRRWQATYTPTPYTPCTHIYAAHCRDLHHLQAVGLVGERHHHEPLVFHVAVGLREEMAGGRGGEESV